MTDQFSMFGRPATVAEPATVQPKAAETPAAPNRPLFGRNVLRAIETQYGPHRRVRAGQIVDEFYIVEMTNGNILEQTTSGELRPADICGGSDRREAIDKARALINNSLDSGMWREIRP